MDHQGGDVHFVATADKVHRSKTVSFDLFVGVTSNDSGIVIPSALAVGRQAG
jgi:hypothetical protein